MLRAFVKCSCSPLMTPTIEGDPYFGTVLFLDVSIIIDEEIVSKLC